MFQVGEMVGYMTVLVVRQEPGSFRKKITVVDLVCVCGEKISVELKRIKRRKSCGCMKRNPGRGMLEMEEIAIRHIYRRTRTQAKERNYEFSLDIDTFREIVKSNCYYCGVEPSMLYRVGGNQVKGSHASFMRNDIDRYDNDQGYTVSNSVPCCKTCNFMKGKLSGEEFLEQIDRIEGHRISQG